MGELFPFHPETPHTQAMQEVKRESEKMSSSGSKSLGRLHKTHVAILVYFSTRKLSELH